MGKEIVEPFKRNERTGVLAGLENQRAEARGGDSPVRKRRETSAGNASKEFRPEHKRAADERG